MKRNAIIRIILHSIAILLLVSTLLAGLFAGYIFRSIDWDLGSLQFHFDDDGIAGGAVESNFTLDAATVKNISIQWASGSVTVRPGEAGDNTIYVTERGASESNQLVWKRTGDTLQIQFCETRVHFGLSFDGSKDLTINVPPDWMCEELEIDAASASVDIAELTIQEVNFDGASGTLRLDNCHVDTLDLDTASGDITFSGTLNTLSCDAASADCRITVTNTPNRIDMDMASGDLELILPENCGFTVELEALSADFHSEYPTVRENGMYVCGDGHCRIRISAMSGDVTILKAPLIPTVTEIPTEHPVLYADSFTKELLLEPLNNSYLPGCLVTVKTDILTDADLELYVNGEFVCKQTESFHADDSNYWSFTFQMPDKTATIQFKTSGGI